MSALPTGTVTFVFTDVEGSTRLFQRLGENFPQLLAKQHEVLRAAVGRWGGVVVKSEGDGVFVAFADASAAITACRDAQQGLRRVSWPPDAELRVRMGMHTGHAEPRDGDYMAIAVNQAARISAAAHGGQVLVSTATRDAAQDRLVEGIAFRELGEYVLKDFDRPQTIFQLCSGGLPDTFPELRTSRAQKHNLPPERTSFVGRAREVAELHASMNGRRLVTLCGPGGVGKTRLAREVAAGALGRLPGGGWLVELAPLGDPALVLPALASVFGVAKESERPLVASIAEAIGPRRLLLVVDNCEHLLDAAAGMIDQLLQRCPELRVIATSRQPLRVAAEKVLTVLPLATEDATSLLRARVEEIRPTALREPGCTSAIEEICARLDGLPLALELAAARARSLSLTQIAARMDQRFGLLTGGNRGSDPRQRTLAAMVDWSYELLSDAERALSYRLSVFAGGWTLEAAEAVCGGAPVSATAIAPVLGTLVDHSLVELRPTQHDMRYGMLETLRAYAADRLEESGDRYRLQALHLRWSVDLAERAYDALEGRDQVEWLGRLDAEHANLLEALDNAAHHPEMAVDGLRLAGALSTYWFIRGRLEGRAWLERTLAACPDAPAAVRLRAIVGLGRVVKAVLGDLGATKEILASARAIIAANEVPASRTAVMGLCALAGVLDLLGDAEQSARVAADALAMARDLDDAASVASAYSIMAEAAFREGQLDRAAELQVKSLGAARSVGHVRSSALAMANLGRHAALNGEWDTAMPLLREAHRLLEELNARNNLGWVLTMLADSERAAGLHESAAAHYRAALVAEVALGNMRDCSFVAWGLASVVPPGHLETSALLYGWADHVSRGHYRPPPYQQAENDRTLIRLQTELGDHRLAELRGRGAELEPDAVIALAENVAPDTVGGSLAS